MASLPSRCEQAACNWMARTPPSQPPSTECEGSAQVCCFLALAHIAMRPAEPGNQLQFQMSECDLMPWEGLCPANSARTSLSDSFALRFASRRRISV